MPARIMPEGADLHFSPAEYAARLARLRAAMEAAGIGVLFTSDPSNMAWLTGFDAWSFYTPQGVVVGPAGEPLYWGRGMDATAARLTCWMADESIHGYADDYVMAADRHAMSDLAALLAERGWNRLPLGVEFEGYYYSPRAHAVLTAAHEGPVLDATGLVNRCRAVKSPAEIAFMRRAARISANIQRRILEVFRPGVPSNVMAAEIYRTAMLGATDPDGTAHGGTVAAICPLMASGRRAAAPHLTWDDRPAAPDTGTFFEISGCYRRYHAPLARTVWLGAPPAEVRKAEEAVLEGIAAGIDAARPGAVAGDVARALHAALARHGIERTGRCGYPVGLSFPPDWGERTYSIRESDDTVLQPGMTFHFMPGIWTEDWGLEITETLLIRESGPAEALTDWPRRLFVIEG